MDSRESGRKAEPLARLEIGNPAVSGIVTSGLDAMKLRRSRADWQRRGAPSSLWLRRAANGF